MLGSTLHAAGQPVPGDTGEDNIMANTDPTAAFEAAVAEERARLVRKEAKRQAREAALAAAGTTTETAPAAPATTPVTETKEQREARLAALVEAKVAEAAKAQGLTVEETDEDIVARLVEARLVPLKQQAAESGQGVARKGLLTDIVEATGDGSRALQEASSDELAHLASASYSGGPGRLTRR